MKSRTGTSSEPGSAIRRSVPVELIVNGQAIDKQDADRRRPRTGRHVPLHARSIELGGRADFSQ